MSRPMRARTLIPILACLALVPVAAGCGSQGEAGLPAGAELVPADVAMFAAIDTEFQSGQWETAGDLLENFPDGERLRGFILDELSSEGIDLEEDVEPALGPQVNVVWLDPRDDQSFVGLTQPDDPEKLQELLDKADEEMFFRDVEGWTAFAEDEEYLDALVQGRAAGSLSADSQFADAMARVAEDALVRLYFNGAVAAPAFEEEAGLDPGAVANLLPGGEVPWISVSLSAEDRGGRFEGAVGFADDPEGYVGPSYEANLPEIVPAGALAYVSFKDLEGQFSKLRDLFAEAEPEFERDIARFENEIGVSFEEDIGPLLAGEGALYVRRGAFIPEVTLLLEVDDEDEAVGVVDDLASGLSDYVPLGEPRTTDIAGVEARQIDIEPPVSLYYAAFDGRLVLTTQRAGIVDLREEGDRLSGDDGFQEALEDADMPDETVGFAYVNLRETIPYMLGFAGAAGENGDSVPDEVERNLEPLEHLVLFGARDGNTVEFSGFLAID
jgi:hypothetical protein